MAGFFSFLKNADTAVGIDIGSSSIKVVQLSKKKGNIILDSYGSLSLGPYGDKERGEHVFLEEGVIINALEVLFKETNITSKRLSLSIPFYKSFLSIIDVPDLPDSTLASVVPYEVRKYIPVPIEDVSFDWKVIPPVFFESKHTELFSEEREQNDEESKKKVFLVVVYNDELKKYKEIVKGTGMNFQFFELEVFSMLRTLKGANRVPVVVVDFGVKSTRIYVVENDIVLQTRSVNQGGEVFTRSIQGILGLSFAESEDYKKKNGFTVANEDVRKSIELNFKEIVLEVKKSIQSFESRYKKTAKKIVFTGGGSLLKGFDSHASLYFDIPVERLSPFSSVQYPQYLSHLLNEAGAEFSIAVGLALRSLE